MNTTLDRLQLILIKDYGLTADQLTPDASLQDLGLDSLGVVELLFTVEDEFNLRLPSDPVPLPMLGDVVAYIDGLIAAQRTGVVHDELPIAG